jgi:hypothetical protein
MKQLTLLTALILITLTGCTNSAKINIGGSDTDPVQVQVTSTALPEIKVPTAAPMDLQDFKWRVLNKKDLLALLTQLNKKPDPNFAIFVLDNNAFKMLDNNIQEMRRFIQEQQATITYYQKLQAGMADKSTH